MNLEAIDELQDVLQRRADVGSVIDILELERCRGVDPSFIQRRFDLSLTSCDILPVSLTDVGQLKYS